MHDRFLERACDASSHHSSGLAALRLAGLTTLVALVACRSAAQHHAAADDQVYGILAQRHAELQLEPGGFSIDPPEDSLRMRILAGDWPVSAEDPAARLSLVQALDIAAENSRTYQTRRENLYLTALDLTFERYLLSNQFFGILAGDANGDLDGIDSKTGLGTVGFTRMLGTGATILGDIGLSIFNDLTTGGGWDTMATFRLAFTQPLLRGSGAKIVKEPLTQAERDVLYEVRSYERFRRTFAFDVSSSIYRLIQQLDTVENRRLNYASLTSLRERNEAMGQAGRMNDIQVDQARRDELDAEQALVLARQALEDQLDDFKLLLGLPVEAPLAVDPEDLARLDLETLVPDDIPEGRAIDLALANRLDHLTVIDSVNDAERKLYVAKDALRAGASVTMNMTNNADPLNLFKFSGNNGRVGLLANLDLPFDRFAERNDYRTAEINLERAHRNLQESRDLVVAEIRDDLRTLAAARESYAIQAISLAVAERSQQSTVMNPEAGRADTRDVLEAERSLVDARNRMTAVRIEYVLAALRLYLDMEILRVEETGLEVDPDLYQWLLEA